MSEKKTYVIAGGTSGIGLEISNRLSAEGHSIIVLGRNEQNFQENNHATFYAHDFYSDEPMPEITGTVDGLIYCPGSINLKPFSALKEQDIIDDFRVNVLGAFRFIQKYQKHLALSDHPGIILFSSVAAAVGMPYHTSVSISKAAVEGLTRSLSAELAPKVRVNCIAPSLTDTPLAQMLLNSDAKRQANAERHPLRKIGATGDIAELAIYLLNAKWMTGQIIGLNGGLGSIFK